MCAELGVKDMTGRECTHTSVDAFPCVCGGVLIIKFNKKLVDYQNKDLCYACSLEL